MKSKPLIVTIASIAVLAGILLFIRAKYLVKPEKKEITQFLVDFKNQLKYKNVDSLVSYFEVDQKPQTLVRLVNILSGNTGFNGKSKPVFDIDVNVDESDITVTNPDLIRVIIPVNFKQQNLPPMTTTIEFKVHRIAAHQFKIMQVDARSFLTDYLSYENRVKAKTIKPQDIFSEVTLQAFADAEKLKSRYDSVVWFAHKNEKTYFYVVKGKWIEPSYRKPADDVCKMGLVGPDLKEVIPAEFDLIHTIGGTFDDLVEVEKNHKRGFYDLTGQVIVPVEYDEIYPVKGDEHLAALRKGDDFYWLQNDYSVSEKADITIADVLANLKQYKSFTFAETYPGFITELNSHEQHNAVYIPPSYLVDLQLIEQIKDYRNPLRRNVDYEDISKAYEVNYVTTATDQNNNWIEATFRNIRDYFVGGRSEFYDRKNMVIADKKHNRVYGFNFSTNYIDEDNGGDLSGNCNENTVRALNDSLLEVVSTAGVYLELDSPKVLTEIPYYHYLQIKDGKLIELKTERKFAFTKFVRMDNTYLSGCTVYNDKTGEHLPYKALEYMKWEIYAEYKYDFPKGKWREMFIHDYPDDNTHYNKSVDDSLTEIDKYNIHWIDQKLKENKDNRLAYQK